MSEIGGAFAQVRRRHLRRRRRDRRRASERLSPRAPTPYSGVVFRPVAPAALTPSPPRAVPSTPERPVPRGTVKGGAAMDARALRVRLPAGGDASPFVAVRAWRRATRGAEEILPAPAPVGAASRVWDNRGIAAIPPTAAASFIVLFRVLARASRAGGATAAVTCKRAKLRGRRARGDDFAHCALISLGDVRRDDGAAPWRAVEMIPPPPPGRFSSSARGWSSCSSSPTPPPSTRWWCSSRIRGCARSPRAGRRTRTRTRRPSRRRRAW